MAQMIHKGISPIKVPENEEIVSIAFPSETISITALDIPETATIDVTACNDDFVWDVLNDTTKPNKKITANNKIYYTTTDNKKVRVYCDSGYDNGSLISNNHTRGYGVITFTNPNTILNVTDEYIYIPDDDEDYVCGIFQYSNIYTITIPSSVTSIGDYAFYGCSGLTSITIPDSVTSIGASAFNQCSGLTSITIPDDVTSIGIGAFYQCSGLTSITIPDGVTSIGSSAFAYCGGLTSITIPDGVTSIGSSAFAYCRGLTSITFKGTFTQWNAITKGSKWKQYVPTTCKVYCTDGTISI